MQCQLCQERQATVHFTKIINNQKVEMHLCEQCANERGQIGYAIPISINVLIAGLLSFENNKSDKLYKNEGYINPDVNILECEKCGMTIEEFQKTGKLGCSNCYITFEDMLSPLIRRLQGSVEHNGKVPCKMSSNVMASKEISRLKNLLSKAIEQEEYEKAAELRDQIRSMEVKSNDSRD